LAGISASRLFCRPLQGKFRSPVGGFPPNPIDGFFLHLTRQLNSGCTINAAASTVAVDGDQLAGSDPGPANPNTT
jgi:hypothetical protein